MIQKQVWLPVLLCAFFDCGAVGASLPLHFENAPGSEAMFISRGSGYQMSLARKHILIQTSHSRAIELDPAFGSELPEPEGIERTGGYSNYLIGNRPDAWRTRVPHFARVRYRGVYPGVDLVFYGNQNQLEYDFVVQPGADASKIGLQFKGALGYNLNAKGDLVLDLGSGHIVQPKPNAYQTIRGKRWAVTVSYLLSKTQGLVKFRLGNYDPASPLTIDPVLLYGTFVGGAGTDFASAVAADSSGNAYLAGSTNSLFIRGSSQQQNLRGPSDCFVTKVNPAGTLILYTTYIGGSGNDTCSSVTVDGQGNVYTAGTTTSTDFPVSASVVQTKYAGGDFDGFAVKLDPTGTRAVYSTYIGGSGFDAVSAMAIDSSGNAYVAGRTSSTNLIGITSEKAIQSRNGGGQDGFLVKLNTTATGVVYGTYLGGGGEDAINGLAVNSSGEAHVTGDTSSTTFPGVGNGSIQRFRRGAKRDAFVAKIAASGSSILYSTYLGGSSDQSASAISLDSAGTAYVTGFTTSVDFPIKGTPFQTENRGGTDAFVAAISSGGTGLLFSTYLGGSGTDYGQSILVDRFGNIYVGGFTNSSNFLLNYRVLPPPGVNSLFVVKILPSVGKTLFATYFSPGDPEAPIALGLNAGSSFDQIFVAGTAVNGFKFPSAKSPPSFPYAGGITDAFVSRLASADVRVTSVNSTALGSRSPRSAGIEPRLITVGPGGDVNIPFTVTNFGPDDADDVVTTVTIAAELTPIRCLAPGGTCTISGDMVTVRYAALAVNSSRVLTVIARANGSNGSNVLVKAEANSATDDGNPTNNFDGAGVNVAGTRPFNTNPVVAVNFGSVGLGQTMTANIQVTPTSLPVDVEFVLTDALGGVPTSFALRSGIASAQRIGILTEIPIVFSPTETGAVTGQLDIRVASLGFTATLDLNGSGVTAAPVITSVTDAAAFRPSLIASNAWVSIFGRNFTTQPQRSWQGSDFNGNQLPRSLGDVTVRINGRPAYIAFMTPGQINALAPSDPLEGANVTVEVTNAQGTTSFSALKQRFVPAFFMLTGNHVAARLLDSTIVGPAGFLGPGVVTRPARSGETVQLFLNGLGPTTPAFPDGAIPSSALSLSPGAVILNIGGTAVIPSFAGLTTTPGLYQINATVPNIPAGEATITFQIGGISTQLPATLTVGR